MSAGVAALWIFAGAATAADPAGATRVVEQLHAGMLEVMKDAEGLGYEGRYRRLAPLVDGSHDLEFIARTALGRYWRKLDRGQQASFARMFRELSLATYASRFRGYAGEQFRTLGQEALPRGDTLVRSVMTTAGGKELEFDYQLRASDGRWRIVNIIVDGVSDLAMKRAEYTGVMAEEGFPGLMVYLEEQIAAARVDN